MIVRHSVCVFESYHPVRVQERLREHEVVKWSWCQHVDCVGFSLSVPHSFHLHTLPLQIYRLDPLSMLSKKSSRPKLAVSIYQHNRRSHGKGSPEDGIQSLDSAANSWSSGASRICRRTTKGCIQVSVLLKKKSKVSDYLSAVVSSCEKAKPFRATRVSTVRYIFIILINRKRDRSARLFLPLFHAFILPSNETWSVVQ
jgi:hypothetical protein